MVLRAVENIIFRKVAPKGIHYVNAVTYDAAQALTSDVYTQMERDFQVVPPITLHSPLPRVMAGVWSIIRESLAAGPVNRLYREATAVAVSKVNECSFCIEAHAGLMKGAAAHEEAEAIVQGSNVIKDPKLNAIVQWGVSNYRSNANILRDPPFSAAEAPEFIGTAIAFHYINRMVNVFLDTSPLSLPKGLRGLKGVMNKVFHATIAKRIVTTSSRQGESLQFLPEADLPDDLSWARSNPAIAGAYARCAAVIEDVEKTMVPKEIRDVLRQRMNQWKGEHPGLSRNWVDTVVTPLPANLHAAGRLALLTAFASYQVDETVVEDFRNQQPGDDQLIGITAWASFTAARKIGTWLNGQC